MSLTRHELSSMYDRWMTEQFPDGSEVTPYTVGWFLSGYTVSQAEIKGFVHILERHRGIDVAETLAAIDMEQKCRQNITHARVCFDKWYADGYNLGKKVDNPRPAPATLARYALEVLHYGTGVSFDQVRRIARHLAENMSTLVKPVDLKLLKEHSGNCARCGALRQLEKAPKPGLTPGLEHYRGWCNKRSLRKDSWQAARLYVRDIIEGGFPAHMCYAAVKEIADYYATGKWGDLAKDYSAAWHEKNPVQSATPLPETKWSPVLQEAAAANGIPYLDCRVTPTNPEDLEGIITMSNNTTPKVESRTFYNGQDLTTQSDDAIIQHIQNLEAQAQQYRKMDSKSATIAKRIAVIEEAAAKLGEYLDARNAD